MTFRGALVSAAAESPKSEAIETSVVKLYAPGMRRSERCAAQSARSPNKQLQRTVNDKVLASTAPRPAAGLGR